MPSVSIPQAPLEIQGASPPSASGPVSSRRAEFSGVLAAQLQREQSKAPLPGAESTHTAPTALSSTDSPPCAEGLELASDETTHSMWAGQTKQLAKLIEGQKAGTRPAGVRAKKEDGADAEAALPGLQPTPTEPPALEGDAPLKRPRSTAKTDPGKDRASLPEGFLPWHATPVLASPFGPPGVAPTLPEIPPLASAIASSVLENGPSNGAAETSSPPSGARLPRPILEVSLSPAQGLPQAFAPSESGAFVLDKNQSVLSTAKEATTGSAIAAFDSPSELRSVATGAPQELLPPTFAPHPATSAGPSTLQPAAAEVVASTPAQAYLTTSPWRPEFGAQFGAQVSTWASQGIQHAQLHLHPSELGPVAIHIRMEGQEAHIEMSALHIETRDALQLSMSELHHALEREGLQLGQADIRGGRGGESTPEPRLHSHSSQGSGEASDSIRASSPPQHRGLLDLYA